MQYSHMLETTTAVSASQQECEYVRAMAKLVVQDKQRAKHHEEAVTRAQDVAMCCVGEASALMRVASKAVAEFADCTVPKLPEIERYPTTRMAIRRPSQFVPVEGLGQDTHTLAHAVTTSREISAGVVAIMQYGAAVRRAAVAVPQSCSAHYNNKTTVPIDNYAIDSPLLEAVPRPVIMLVSGCEPRGEDMHELAETLRFGRPAMYSSTDKWYLAREMRAMGLVAARLGDSLAGTEMLAREGAAIVAYLQHNEQQEHENTVRDLAPTSSKQAALLAQHCRRVRDASYQVVRMAAATAPALALEAEATEMFWTAAHKHYLNVRAAADAARPAHKRVFGSFWDRALRRPRYQAMVRARELLDQAWKAELLAAEALEALDSEIYWALEETAQTLPERRRLLYF
ncbi:MAG: hypothetical protein STHCBS139747_002687 [Sporothrix thermara]